MGTSSLYKGPKITSLLPSDYNPDVNPELDAPDETIPTKDEAGEAESQQDDTENEESNEQKEDQSNQPSVKWGTVRSSMRKAMNNRSSGNAKSAIRNHLVDILMPHDKLQRFAERPVFSTVTLLERQNPFINDL